MRKVSLLLVCMLLFLLWGAASPALAILAGINPDVHMDILDAVANDFHIEGRIKSGWPGQGWAQPPVLVHHEDGGFPDFSYVIAPDYSSPGQNEYFFRAHWKGEEFQYCEWLHLGLVFDLVCHNLVIDLQGYWTLDGKRIEAGMNGGTILLPGFEVNDIVLPDGQGSGGPQQKIRIQNDSPIEATQGINGQIVQMDLLKFTPEDVEVRYGSKIGLFKELRSNGQQEDFEWIPVEFPQGPPPFNVDSFFDVFFDIKVPDQPHPAIPLPLNPGDILVSRVRVAYQDNAGQQELHWTWHMHESHELDYGDAPDGPYPTLNASNGARHIIRGPWLGNANDGPDGEQDGQPEPAALGDDNFDFNDDEDGVLIPTLVKGQTSTLLVTVSNGGGVVDAWIDFNGNGTWGDIAAEKIFAGFLPDGVHPINVNTPANAAPGQSFARFRISQQGGLFPVGYCDNGEVEDHVVDIRLPEPDELDFGDAPDSPKAPLYPTLTVNNGARHIVGILYMGNLVDSEADGQPNAAATGDDINPAGADDEDGVNFLTVPLIPGKGAKVQVTCSQSGLLSAWVDFADDGSWAQAGDQIFADVPVSAGVNNLTFSVPMSAKPNTRTYARFRLSTQPGLSYDGSARNGEVEDYILKIGERCGVKWVQGPDETETGIDIRVDSNDGVLRRLADDFLCTSIDSITDVHLWTSWRNDNVGEIESLRLKIYSDDPVGPGGSDRINVYSKPDKLLWEYVVPGDRISQRLYAKVIPGEYWWDLVQNELIPNGDTQIWQVDILIDPDEAFMQEGTPDEPVVYWLEVSDVKTSEGTVFGWKTRRWPNHWNDDATFGTADGDWRELRYPASHPYHGATFEDLAAGTTYVVGDVFSSGGVDMKVEPFQWSNNIWTSNGQALVDTSQMAGGTGNDLMLNNVNVGFDFHQTLYNLDLMFADYGGNVNIEINGDFRNLNDLIGLHGTQVGGVDVTVLPNPGGNPNQYLLHLDGQISSFAIGGQELWVDNVSSSSIDMAFAITNEKFCPQDADLNCDGFVDLRDFEIMTRQWLTKRP